MTKEYRETLLKYITGGIPNEKGNEEILFEKVTTKINNLEEKMNEFVNNNQYESWDLTGSIYSDSTSNYLFYGKLSYFKDSNEESLYNGFIVILSENFEVLKILDSYDSGTKLKPFVELYFDEDGNIYGIDDDYENTGKNLRFIMLNNPTLGVNDNFYVRLRASYYFPKLANSSAYTTSGIGSHLKKVPGESTYLMFLYNTETNKYGILELKVNVGSENEWKFYSISENLTFYTFDFIIEKRNDNSVSTIVLSNTSEKELYIYYFNGSSITKINTIPTNSDSISKVAMLSSNKIYMSSHSQDNNGNLILKLLLLNNNTITTIHTNTYQKVFLTDSYYLKINNGNVFTRLFKAKGLSTSEGDYVYDVYSGVIYNDNYYEEYITTIKRTLINYNVFPVKNIFLLNQNFFQLGNTVYVSNMIINSNGYNGKPYVNQNSLIPRSVVLNSNDETIFARNIYNKSINTNTTISSVEIPSTYLNDIRINFSNLLGKTNLKLVRDNRIITKNIYEAVDINFINSLLISDENNPNNKVSNLEASAYLNKAINNENQYNNAKMTKVKINYMDNTNRLTTFSLQKENKIESLEIEGKSVQNETPTPESPVEIQTVKGIRNLFDKDNMNVGTLYGSASTMILNSNNNAKSFYIEVKPNTTYTIKRTTYLTADISVSSLTSIPTTGVSITVHKNSTNDTPITITTGENDKYLNVYYLWDNTSYTDEQRQEVINSIMIEEGPISHGHVPYGFWLQVKITSEEQEKSILIDMNKPNLFDKDNANIFEGLIDGSTKSLGLTSGRKTIYISCKPNTTYTIKKIISSRFIVGYTTEIPNNGVSVRGITTKNSDIKMTITTDTNANYLCVFLYHSTYDTSITLQEILDSIKIYEGIGTDDYYELSSIGDTKDTLIIQNRQTNINQKIGKIVLNGSENWLKLDNTSYSDTILRFQCRDFTNVLFTNGVNPLIKSSHFEGVVLGFRTKNGIARQLDSSGINIFIDSSYLTDTTLTAFKTWLSNNPVTVYYELAEPQTITLNGTYDIELFEGENTITTNDELQPKVTIKNNIDSNALIIELALYIDKQIDNIQFISNDETVSYHTIDLSNLEVGKYYKINQRLEVK